MRRFLTFVPKNNLKNLQYFSKGFKTNCLLFVRIFRILYGGCIWLTKCLTYLRSCMQVHKGKARTCYSGPLNSKLERGLHLRGMGVDRVILHCLVSGICLHFMLSFSSCSSYKKITYFKDLSDSSAIYTQGENIKGVAYLPLTIQPDDILQVVISTIDPEANQAFNINQDNNSNAKNDPLNMPKNLSGYLVDKKGNIELPVLGTFHVAGSTTEQIKDTVLVAASKLLKQPVVNVRLANFTVNVLGEVTRPGSYVVTGEKASLLDALGMAGDMTIYGKRDNVILMRTENGVQKKVARFNLNNTQMLSSPYFYLRQGDVIYVEPTKAKAASTDMSATKTYAIAGSVLSVLLIVISRL